MNIITKTAMANLRKNKSRNILIGIAIGLTALLLTVVPTVTFAMMDLQMGAVERVYPTFHAVYRDVTSKTADQLKEDSRLKNVGLREDPGIILCEDKDIHIAMMYTDKNTNKLNRFQLAEGILPTEADEIVVSEGILKAMGLQAQIGDTVILPFQAATQTGLGQAQEKEFLITGMVKDSKESLEKGTFSALVSQKFTNEVIGESDHRYRVYFQMNVPQSTVTDTIQEKIQEIAKEYQITENNVRENSAYLYATYIDPATYSIMAVIMVLILLAGILTIYSIYYVSMMDKVQEFGKLRAIGATKAQIRKLVFREGFAVAAAAVPVGLLLGTVTGILVLKGMVADGILSDNILAKEMEKMVSESMFFLVHPWILILAAAVTLLGVYVSLLRPMQVAGKISAVEALRYQGSGSNKKIKRKRRKGHETINLRKLTTANLGRNKKRTVVTVVTLSVTGIFFIVIATVISCMDPKVYAQDMIRGDVEIYLDNEENNEMYPERSIVNIQQNNPLGEEFLEQIEAIEGIKKVEKTQGTLAFLEEVKEETGEFWETGISGLNVQAMKELKKFVKQGDIDDPKLKEGTGVVLGAGYLQKYTDLSLGDTIHLNLTVGQETVRRAFEIVAVAPDCPSPIGGFSVPASIIQDMGGVNMTDRIHIYTEKNKADAVADKVKELIDGNDILEMRTYQQEYESGDQAIGYTSYAAYGLLIIFGLIGILNLVNTMINSIYARRRELGVLQAIGLSGKQNIRMLQMEGLFYTTGTLILSLGIGSIGGYLCFAQAKAASIMSIKHYEYPVFPAILLIITVLLVQLLITYLVNKSLKKESLIDRIRYAD